MPQPPIDVSPTQLKQWLDSGEAVVVDVREGFEHAEERIAGAHHMALSAFGAAELHLRFSKEANGKRVVFHCLGGKRSADAAERFSKASETGNEPTYHLAGGIAAWKAAKLPTIKIRGSVIPVMRQVQLVAGFLIALGTALGFFLHNDWFFILPAFVGCGFMFAGATGWCGMAMLLGKMPWNKHTTNGQSPSCNV